MPWWALASALLLALGNAASGPGTGLLQWLLIPALTAWWVLPGSRRLLVFALQALLAYGVAVMMLPWLGWGWGELDYAHFITLYAGPRFCEILDNAHNLPLHLAVELCLPAAVAICGALSWLVWRARPWAETDVARQMAWGVLAVILLHSLLEYPLWYGPFQMAVGLCGVMLWQRQPATGDEKALYEAPKMPLPHSAYGLLAILLIAICGYAAWDYQRISQLYLAPESRSAAYRTGYASQGSRLVAVCQSGAVCRAYDHATGAGQRHVDF